MIIDSRTGDRVQVGDRVVTTRVVVDFPEGTERVLDPPDSYRLLAVRGWLRPVATMEQTYRPDLGGPPVTRVIRLPLIVRWTHPLFFGRRVLFVPS